MKIRFPWLWPAIIILSALAACIVTYVMPDTQIRAVIVMSFLFFCPGMALVRFLRLNDIVAEWIIAVSLSFAIDAIVGGLFLYTGHWSLSGILITLLVISLMGAAGQLVILHPMVAQRLSALSIFKMPEDITASETMALPKISLTERTGKAVSIEDQQTAYLPSYKLTSGTNQTRDVTEANTVQMSTVTRNIPAQEDITDHDTMHVHALEHIDANDLPDIANESQSSTEAIEEKATAHVPSISISYSPVPQAKPIMNKQPLLEEQETQQLSSATQEKDTIEETGIVLISDSSPSSAGKEQTIEEKEASLVTSLTLEDIIEEQDTAAVPSSAADKAQAIEEKETVNIPSVQAHKPDLIPEQTPANSPVSEKGQEDQEEKEPITIAETPADSPTSEKEQEEQKEKGPVVTTAKAESSKETLNKAQAPSPRTIIPRTNPHKAIVQESATKSVLRKRRLTREAAKQEVSEQDNI